MKYRNIFSLIILFLVIGSPIAGYSQCKNFAKKKCMPKLKPFIHNGQLNSTTLMEGESAELGMTFYSGQDYRLLICSHKILEGTYFEVKDTDNNLIYSSVEKSTELWDFNVNSTQQLKINVVVPESEGLTEMVSSGCVSVMVGFRD